jgi:xylose isomerase
MDQRASRPERWHIATDRAKQALESLQELHTQWAIKLEELENELNELCDQASVTRQELDCAISELIGLQVEYDHWRSKVPDNLSESRPQEPLARVQDFDFEGIRKRIPEFAKFALDDDLRVANEKASDFRAGSAFEDVLDTLCEAKACKLPRGYGRD